jgi:copper transporter 1
MFAGSCIGVICLVISLEFLRRAGREYDSFIIRKARLRQSSSPALLGNNTCDITCSGAGNDFGTPVDTPKQATSAPPASFDRCSTPYRPSLMEHSIRSLFHMVQFAVAYFIMLLAMYYNGYIIICIFIGAFLGAFIFAWEPVGMAKE